MTVLQIFEHVQTELNKAKAPSLLIDDFVYFLNKSVLRFVNKNYNQYEKTQQFSDSLRTLQSTVELIPQNNSLTGLLFQNTKEVFLPDDYMHILNCIFEFKILNSHLCNIKDSIIHVGGIRGKSDTKPQVLNNYYFKPSINVPYYYINNVTTIINYPTQDNKISINYDPIKESNIRYGNSEKIRMELDFGKNNNYSLEKIYVDYLKYPKYLNLTQDMIDDVIDSSPVVEFSDYVIQEIINDLVSLILENNTNPRLQSQIPLNQTIAQ